MTPLLWEIMDRATGPKKDRPQQCLDMIAPHSDDLHSFDCTGVQSLLDILSPEDGAPSPTYVFLPSPSTWLEWTSPKDKMRWAVLLADERGGIIHSVTAFKKEIVGDYPGVYSIRGEHYKPFSVEGGDPFDLGVLHTLALINTPGVIGLHTRPAHKGRARKLRSLGVGSFPLHAWHELTIGGATKDRMGHEVESHVSDRMPLHFVRSHLKPSLGIRVPAHWRGNAAYGIKRTRYKVERKNHEHS